ncbi:MAG: AAA family ATPase [Methanobrevibacter sp.]|jgi:hypothetical protein|nr:AAA family ATPase [Candidatus Methanoflexus mossambicus]
MEEFQSLEDIAQKIKDSQKKVTLLFAFNATGKTRLSMEFKNLVNEISDDDETIKHVIYYNAFTEDLFYWDNDLDNDEERKLKINNDSTFISLIKDQGKENEIAEKFRKFTSSKIEPIIDIANGEVSFSLVTGDENSVDNIKVSKGEESIFIWSVFFVLMETVIDELNIDEVDDRSNDEFNPIQYICIDDPISSFDDNNVIDSALELVNLVKTSKSDNGLKFIISTHHALFYNVLHNDFNNANKYVLKKDEDKYLLKSLKNSDSPFGYHLLLIDEIKSAIENNNIKRFHFNLMRNVLEKTAHFLGYDGWKNLITEENREAYIRRINLYSHSNHSALETRELEPHEQQFLIRIFNRFISDYNWRMTDNE